MENINFKNLENLTIEQKKQYLWTLRELCEAYEVKKSSKLGKKIALALCPFFQGVDFEIHGEENIPTNDSVIFICNHSNSHDAFMVQGVTKKLERNVSILASSESIALIPRLEFKFLEATLIDRTNATSKYNGILELAKRNLSGQDVWIFGESTWNLHPILPMLPIKIGSSGIGAITEKSIIPVIFEYVETPQICEKEKELYTRCIVTFGKPIKIDSQKSLIVQTLEIQSILEKMRRANWKQLGIKKETLTDVDPQLYINHTYLKKYGAVGVEYDTLNENQFLLLKNGMPVENEYSLNDEGQLVPGIILKRDNKK